MSKLDLAVLAVLKRTEQPLMVFGDAGWGWLRLDIVESANKADATTV